MRCQHPILPTKRDSYVAFRIPAHYLSKRSRLVIKPLLLVGDSVVGEYQPLALYTPIYTKKAERQRVLDHYTDPYHNHKVQLKHTAQPTEVPYAEWVQLPSETDQARMVAIVSEPTVAASARASTP